MPLFLSHVAVKIRGLYSVYIVYGAKGWHIETQTPSNVECVKQLFNLDNYLSIRNVADELSINHETVCLIVKDELRLWKLCAKLVPKNFELMFAMIGLKQLSQKTFSNLW